MKEAVVLAGGLGTRLRSLVPDLPKPMADIAGRPFLDILLASLCAHGFNRVVLSLGYLSHRVVDHFGERFHDMDLVYAIEDRPLGTGGALRFALSRCTSDNAFVFNGDTYLDLDIAAVRAQFSRGSAPIIVARDVPDTARFGRLTVDGGRVIGIGTGIDGPGLINAGCYLLPTALLQSWPEDIFSFEADYLAVQVHKSRFDVFVCHGQFIDIGIPDDYRRAQHLLAGLP